MSTSTFAPGNAVRLTATITETDSGAKTDPGTMTFSIETPAGATTEYVYGTDTEVTKSEAGVYVFEKVYTTSGLYRWRAHGEGSADVAEEGTFKVDPSHFTG